ncbi:MAG: hypothetical protein WDA16_07870 [Candidatus Thermoplasmatota archaeon]
MNECLYCGAKVQTFQAFCDSTCEGLFGVAETNECAQCREDYRLVGFTRDGRPVMGCKECGESYDVPAPVGVA